MIRKYGLEATEYINTICQLKDKIHNGSHIVNFMRKSLIQSFAAFWSVARSYEMKKFWIRRLWRHTRESFHHWFSLHILLLILWRSNLPQSFMVFLAIFHELWKFQDSEPLNCVATLLTSTTRMNIHNMLIVVSM